MLEPAGLAPHLEAVVRDRHGPDSSWSTTSPSRSRRRSHSARLAATHPSSGDSPGARIRQVRIRPTFDVSTSPDASRTLTCCITALSVMDSGRESSDRGAGPRLSRSTIARRLGSARARNV